MTTPILKYKKKLDKKILIGSEPDTISGKVWFYDIGGESNKKIKDFNDQLNTVFFETNNFADTFKQAYKYGSIHGDKTIKQAMEEDITKLEKKIEEGELNDEDKVKKQNQLNFYKKHTNTPGKIVYQYFVEDGEIYVISNNQIDKAEGDVPETNANKKLKDLTTSDKLLLYPSANNTDKYDMYVVIDTNYYRVITDIDNPVTVTLRGLDKDNYTNIYPKGFGNTNINSYNIKVINATLHIDKFDPKNVEKLYRRSMRKSRKRRSMTTGGKRKYSKKKTSRKRKTSRKNKTLRKRKISRKKRYK
jgi:hypothetical protein